MKTANFGVLNIVAHPHPPSTYRRLFEAAGDYGQGVQYWGDQFVKLSPISETRDGVFTGRIAVWTEIDKRKKAIKKKTLVESALSETGASIPDDIGFNSRVFAFAFRERSHEMFVELENQEGHKLAISSVQKMVYRVLHAVKPDEVKELNVYVSAQKDAIDLILSTSRLSKIEIVLNAPNPDDLEEEKRKALKELDDMNASQLRAELTKANGEESLQLLPRYKIMAEIAKDNGYVRAVGREGNRRVERSTKDLPKIFAIELLPDESSAIATRRIAEAPENYE